MQKAHKNKIIIAHRGLSSLAPENTMTAFRKAQELGCTWIEFDVALTKDSFPVIIHDITLGRTTNVKGALADFTYQQISQFDAGSWFAEQFNNEKIPTFAEMLSFLKRHKLSAVIDIKPRENFERDIATTVIQFIHQYAKDYLDNFIIASFSETTLQYAYLLEPKLRYAFGIHEWEPAWQLQVQRLPYYSIHINHEILTANETAWLKNKNKKIFSYTVNDAAEAERLFAIGVDGIFTDRPQDYD